MTETAAPARVLWRREVVRFGRQRSRIVGALFTPLLFWVMLGFGLDRSFVTPGSAPGTESAADTGYVEYFFPGTIMLMVLFTAIFSTMSVIEDRREGFLQAVLVAPVSRLGVVLGKVLGGATLATLQGLIFLALWPTIGAFPGWGATVAAVVVIFLAGIGLTALGLCVAWSMDSAAAFHGIINVVLMPMWLLSGAVFPVATAPGWMRAVMWANPLTYPQAVLAHALRGESAAADQVTLWLALPMTLVVTVGLLALAAWVANRPRRDGT